ncbi:MAG: hypothetical protein ACT4QC_16465 [Planctomycetaceae bacterium]
MRKGHLQQSGTTLAPYAPGPQISMPWRVKPRIVVVVLLVAVCGCGNPEEAGYDALIKSRGSAQDALTSQGAKIATQRMPVVRTEAFMVDLSGVKSITDETFALLKQMQNGVVVLELNLAGTDIADDQIARLNVKEVSGGLLKLNLSHTKISDKGLAEITNMPALMELDLTDTNVSPEGVIAFRKSRAEDTDVRAKKPKIRR